MCSKNLPRWPGNARVMGGDSLSIVEKEYIMSKRFSLLRSGSFPMSRRNGVANPDIRLGYDAAMRDGASGAIHLVIER
jgi:hypothetical protein